MFNRKHYVVVADFVENISFGISKCEYQYKSGDIVNLRVNGRIAKEWINKGYIKEIK